MKRREIIAASCAVLGLLIAVAPLWAAVLRVDVTRPPGGNGSTWTNAYNDLSVAIAAALNNPGADELWVAMGTYRPASQSSSFALHGSLEIYGGFLGVAYGGGGESSRNQRDFARNETILSGDIGTTGSQSDNCFTVVKDESAAAVPARLDGFTITGGVGSFGAGINISSGSSPTIANCRIVANGRLSGPDPTGFGGGIYFSGNSAASIVDCVFESNRAGRGGAVWLQDAFSPTQRPSIRRCRFIDNRALHRGGAIENLNAAGLTVQDCVFDGNRAESAFEADPEQDYFFKGGGAIENRGIAMLINCLCHGNRAALNGGAVNNEPGGSLTIVNCTFSNNHASWQGGGIYIRGGTTSIHNSIVWSNSDSEGQDHPSQIRVVNATPTVTYSCIMDSAIGGTAPFGGANNNNVDADPQFIEPNVGNYRLIAGTPCINGGNNAAIGGVSTDIDGRTRILAGTIDMGPHEYNAAGDCDSNGTADDAEIAADVSRDCNNNGMLDLCELTGADCNGNGTLDSCETASGASTDCNANGTPDECEVFWPDCNANCIADSTEMLDDCDTDGTPDVCDAPLAGRWTMGSDFEEGTLINVRSIGPIPGGTMLVMNPAEFTSCLPYVWVPCTARDTVVLIRSDESPASGLECTVIKGEYRTSPENRRQVSTGSYTPVAAGPQGMAVDLDGSLWVANRAGGMESDTIPQGGSVTKIGLVIGGTRVDNLGQPADKGPYLRPPFEYCTCEDRDGDGLIRTSTGMGDILNWGNYDGTDDSGAVAGETGVRNAEDECILRHTRLASLQSFAVAVDRDNNVWAGGLDTPRIHQKIDSFSGVLSAGGNSEFDAGTRGGLGAIVACRALNNLLLNELWITSEEGPVIRVPTDSVSTITELLSGNTSGVGIDTAGGIWVGSPSGGTVYRISPPSTVSAPYPVDSPTANVRGVAVGRVDDNIWTANFNKDTISRLENNGDLIGTINANFPQLLVKCEPSAISVDSQGKVWFTCKGQKGNVKRIDPQIGAAGAIDLVVDLQHSSACGNVSPDAEPTGLIGMSGVQSHLATRTGVWSVVHDGVHRGTEWARVFWNQECGFPLPALTDLLVQVRASDYVAAITRVPYTTVNGSGEPLSGITGRYVQIRVQFNGPCPGAELVDSPLLCDLRVVPRFECCKGDTSGDDLINALDIEHLMKWLFNPSECLIAICPADINEDGEVTKDDIGPLIDLLLAGAQCEGSPRFDPTDCNSNGVDDISDIFDGASADCNGNGTPDECEIDENSTAPGGPFFCTEDCAADVDGSGVPDECEPDCNSNGTPDAWDISQAASNDANTNGVPDECEKDCNSNGVPDDWDVSQATSADCNTNGVPDECEPDCNTNGVPDDCDIDPSDPDGDAWVSPDCNGNEYPDECDLKLPPPFGSLDCNDNGVPDECDIAACESDPACDDCNANGVPDECDIAAEISEDANTNGIPDECEGESLMGGGGGESMMSSMGDEGDTGETPAPPGDGESMMYDPSADSDAEADSDGGAGTDAGGPPLSPEEEVAAWEAFFEWSMAQCWGSDCETSGAEQFAAMVAKMRELGLALEIAGS